MFSNYYLSNSQILDMEQLIVIIGPDICNTVNKYNYKKYNNFLIAIVCEIEIPVGAYFQYRYIRFRNNFFTVNHSRSPCDNEFFCAGSVGTALARASAHAHVSAHASATATAYASVCRIYYRWISARKFRGTTFGLDRDRCRRVGKSERLR